MFSHESRATHSTSTAALLSDDEKVVVKEPEAPTATEFPASMTAVTVMSVAAEALCVAQNTVAASSMLAVTVTEPPVVAPVAVMEERAGAVWSVVDDGS